MHAALQQPSCNEATYWHVETLQQTAWVDNRLCGKAAAKYAASMRQICSRSIYMKFMNIHDKEYAARLQQVCSKTNLPVKMMTVCSKSAAGLCL